MKKFYLMAVSALLLSSCSKEDSGINTSAGGEVMKFTGAVSRTTDSSIGEGTENTQVFPETDGDTDSKNCIVIFMDKFQQGGTDIEYGKKATMDSDGQGNIALRDNGSYYTIPTDGYVNIYSMYPNDKFGYGSQPFPTAEFLYEQYMHSNREYVQTGKNKDLSTDDLMLAVNKNVTSNQVELNYFHLQSNISVALKRGEGVTNDTDLSGLTVRVHVPSAKFKLQIQNLKTWLADVDNTSDLASISDDKWKELILTSGGGNANFIFKIDTHVTSDGKDYDEYGRAFVGSVYEITDSNKQNAYIEILKSGYIPETSGNSNPDNSSYIVGKVDIPVGTKFLPNKRYIFTITVNKQSGTQRRSGGTSYSVASSEMLIQDCSTGEIVK